jgi:hypothetical protein
MSEHTPGPWELEESPYADGTPWCLITAGDPWSDNKRSMGFRLSGIMRPQDARLIASAPDLLAALQQIAEMSPPAFERGDDPTCGVIDIARAAIAKATGEK